jgi:hypothetical protein
VKCKVKSEGEVLCTFHFALFHFTLPIEVNELRKLTLLIMFVLCATSAWAFAQGKAACYTTWDDNYFYIACQVDDPDVTGTNTQPFSTPWNDDAVEVFLETDNKHATGSSKNAYHMAVSCAGGSAFSQGGDDGLWKPKKIFTFKYSSLVDGSINNPEDLDNGYTIEMAIPWYELGVTPTPGTMMSFNLIIRMRGDTTGFVSLSPKVKTETDIHDASKWVDIVFTAPTFGASTLSLDKIVSSRYITRVPLIDGQVRPTEYNKNTSFDLPLPIVGLDKPKNQLQKMMLAYYFYGFQGDTHKSAPNGASILTDQPVGGVGPWFSYDRVQWHKDQLSDMKRAGVDIVLPAYWGDAPSRAGFANKGLDVMVEALRELKTAKKPYPLVGMYLDTSCMPNADLRKDDAKKAFYLMIRSFYERVPEEFRAQVLMADERAGKPCYIVQLYSARPFANLDGSFITYCNERFAKEFDAHLLWIGANDFKSKSCDFDGYCRYGAGLGFTYDESAKVRIGAVGPGYDDCAVPGSTTPIRSRENGDTYRGDWVKLLAKRPNWVILDGWNRFDQGTELSGSRQYGFTYVDATAIQGMKFRGPRDYDAKYMRQDVPATIQAGTFYQADVLVQNDGIRTWRAGDGYALSYRWYLDGKPAGDSQVRRPIMQDILPGHAAEINIGVNAIKDNGDKLADGKYELRFEMFRMSDNKWFSNLGDDGLSVPVTVGKPEESRARFLTVDGPVMMKTATNYTYKLRVRNDGTSTWKAAAASVSARLFTAADTGSADEIIIAPARAVLAKDVAPGEVADVDLTVNLKDAAGRPVPVWKQSDPWSYYLGFEVTDTDKPVPGALSKVVDIFDADYGAVFIASDVPDAVDAAKTFDVKLVIRNTGPETWTAGAYSVGYHWYYLDGTEAVWDGQKTPIKIQMRPSDPAGVITAKLTTPSYDGRYILAWDLADKDKWASTSEISRSGDLLTTEVTVQNGKLLLTDLSKLFDASASSPDRNRASGNFDAQGFSFPAESMPPDIGIGKPNDIYPCGYECEARGSGLESSRRISFRYGPKAAGDKNAIICAGQTILVDKDKYSKLHVLAAAIEPEQPADFGLGYTDSVETAHVVMTSWQSEPLHGEEVALVALHRHEPAGDDRARKCRLFHYTIPVDGTRQLTAIVLPKNDKVRVLAITIER